MCSDYAPGAPIHAALHPEDIALATQPVTGISMQNNITGRIVHLHIGHDHATCVVDCGVRLVVDVTRQAVSDLGLHEGRRVWCLFKAQALRYLAVSGGREVSEGTGARRTIRTGVQSSPTCTAHPQAH